LSFFLALLCHFGLVCRFSCLLLVLRFFLLLDDLLSFFLAFDLLAVLHDNVLDSKFKLCAFCRHDTSERERERERENFGQFLIRSILVLLFNFEVPLKKIIKKKLQQKNRKKQKEKKATTKKELCVCFPFFCAVVLR
jgi:hypothetical protein